MSAQELRQAAALMRERAEAATPGPWGKVEHHGRDLADEGYSYVYVGSGPGGLTAEVASTYPPGREEDPCEENAEHIASWDPSVAVLVADLLDSFAEHLDSHECEAHCEPGGCAESRFAITVAHAYLGSES